MEMVVQTVGTVVAILGGLLALYKYFSDKREQELREWQKVVIFKILRQTEAKALTFNEILGSYRSEAQAFTAVNLKKKEISEDALRRVLLELASSNIITIGPSDTFWLKGVKREFFDVVNQELIRLVAPNPFVYTLDEFAKEISPKTGVEIPLLKNTLRLSIDQGLLVRDDQGRIAFPK